MLMPRLWIKAGLVNGYTNSIYDLLPGHLQKGTVNY